MAKPTSLPPAPKELSKLARRLWVELQTDFVLSDSAGQVLLTQALHAWDRCEAARKLVDREGPILQDRFGQAVPHPAAKIERDSRAQFLAALKALNLDVAAAKPPGRPLGS